jgi:hypothetical protein
MKNSTCHIGVASLPEAENEKSRVLAQRLVELTFSPVPAAGTLHSWLKRVAGDRGFLQSKTILGQPN